MELAGDEVRRLRMRKQYLWDAAESKDLREVVRSVVGINAQRQSAMMLSLRARIRGLERRRVEEAIAETRELVATWGMRGTIHLLDSRDIRCLVALLGRIFITASKGRRARLGLSDAVVEEGCAEIFTIMSGKEPMTRWELMDQLEKRGFSLDRKGQAPIHLIRSAALKGLVCLGPYRPNGEPTYVPLDGWISNPEATKASLDGLINRYIEGYGPADMKDFAAWSGISLTRARQAWDPGTLKEINVDGRKLWANGIASPPAGDPVVRLLPSFDSYVLGYGNRDLLVAKEHRKDVYRGGQVAPTLIIDGEVAGIWKYERRGKKIAIEVSPFRPLGSETKRTSREEAEDVARFLGGSLSFGFVSTRISR